VSIPAKTRPRAYGAKPSGPATAPGLDSVQTVALVARAKRDLLLRVYRHRLRREDLEDSYSQAVLELLAHAKRGGRFASTAHVANTLEQRFVSRVQDRRRAVSGRSPMQAALERAVSFEGVERDLLDVVDRRAELEELAILRQELRLVCALARRLTDDQRLVLAAQLAGMSCADFCGHYAWSREKYRKVAQRARARLRELMAQESSPAQEPSRVPPPASASEQTTEMPTTMSPTRRYLTRAAGGRSNGRPHGDSHPRASGRNPEISPPRVPAARVHERGPAR
jgi:DNA-directed RNA polymerase specialized sigma24 family protein